MFYRKHDKRAKIFHDKHGRSYTFQCKFYDHRDTWTRKRRGDKSSVHARAKGRKGTTVLHTAAMSFRRKTTHAMATTYAWPDGHACTYALEEKATLVKDDDLTRPCSLARASAMNSYNFALAAAFFQRARISIAVSLTLIRATFFREKKDPRSLFDKNFEYFDV